MNPLRKIRHLFRPHLSCEEANTFIMDFLDDRLDSDLREKFENHLTMCPKCMPFLDQYRQTVRLVHEDGQIDVPPDVISHTITFLREHLSAGPDANSSAHGAA